MLVSEHLGERASRREIRRRGAAAAGCASATRKSVIRCYYSAVFGRKHARTRARVCVLRKRAQHAC